MAVTGQAQSFFKRFKFVVEIDNIGDSAWEKAGPLEYETAVIEQWQGGGIIPAAKDPGRVTHSDLVLQRGATTDMNVYDWCKSVSDMAKNAGDVGPKYKRNLDIVQQERDGVAVARFRVYEAWPRKFTAGDWDNNADENVMEQVTLVYRRFEKLKV